MTSPLSLRNHMTDCQAVVVAQVTPPATLLRNTGGGGSTVCSPLLSASGIAPLPASDIATCVNSLAPIMPALIGKRRSSALIPLPFVGGKLSTTSPLL